MTLVALEVERSSGRTYVSVATRWVHWSSNTPRYELREPRSDFNADMVIDDWERLGKPARVVDDEKSLREAIASGGGIITPRDIAKRVLYGVVRPASCVNLDSAGRHGFAEISAVPQSWLRRTPTETVRRLVDLRDRGRCRECGNPAHQTGKRAPLHHWREWRDGGLTHPHNLMLLCAPCHTDLHRAHGVLRKEQGPAALPKPPTRDAWSWFIFNRVIHRFDPPVD